MYSLLNREEKQKLKIIKTHKDQLIFREDEDCEYAGIVVSGQISIRSYNLNGKEVIYTPLIQAAYSATTFYSLLTANIKAM